MFAAALSIMHWKEPYDWSKHRNQMWVKVPSLSVAGKRGSIHIVSISCALAALSLNATASISCKLVWLTSAERFNRHRAYQKRTCPITEATTQKFRGGLRGFL